MSKHAMGFQSNMENEKEKYLALINSTRDPR
ncbi:hypothetical protein OIU74_004949, partial [Salix koriyanagi]